MLIIILVLSPFFFFFFRYEIIQESANTSAIEDHGNPTTSIQTWEKHLSFCLVIMKTPNLLINLEARELLYSALSSFTEAIAMEGMIHLVDQQKSLLWFKEL